MSAAAKRFPSSCRYFTQGNCRAGRDCQFAHILPLSNSPKKIRVESIESQNTTSSSSPSLQKVIRDIELDQLDKNYAQCIRKSIKEDISKHTLIELLLPIENKQDLNVLLIIPYNYPDNACILRIQNIDMSTETTDAVQTAFEKYKWPQMRHPTLVQQLNWLISHFDTL